MTIIYKVERRYQLQLQESGFSDRFETYSDISDNELDKSYASIILDVTGVRWPIRATPSLCKHVISPHTKKLLCGS